MLVVLCEYLSLFIVFIYISLSFVSSSLVFSSLRLSQKDEDENVSTSTCEETNDE